MRFRFTIRELLWLTLVLAMAFCSHYLGRSGVIH
jgi:hypothetical protein